MSLENEIAVLRAEVQTLKDIEAIKNLTHSYMQAMHDARWEDATNCFSDDATYDHGPLGNLANKEAIRDWYVKFMPAYESAGGWAFDILANPTVAVSGDSGEGRWFLLTLLIDPDTKEAAWNVATLEYTYVREADGWKFLHNRCISEHQLVPYVKGWGASAASRASSFTEAEVDGLPMNFDLIKSLGGKQMPGKLCHSIRGWTVPTHEPQVK